MKIELREKATLENGRLKFEFYFYSYSTKKLYKTQEDLTKGLKKYVEKMANLKATLSNE